MKQRLPLILSTTALAVAVFGSTPLGEAAGDLAAQIPPLAKRANFAKTAGTANNAKKLGGQPASKYVRLGSNGKLPASLVAGAQGSQGQQGPQGPKGDPGPKGDRGAQGPNGTVAAFTKSGIANPSPTPTAGYTSVLKLELPPGRYVIFGRAHLGQGGQAQYSGFCRVVAGNQSDGLGVQGVRNPTTGGVGSGSNVFVSVIQEFTASGVADLLCWSPAGAPTVYSSPQITAIAITPTAIRATPAPAKAGG